MDERPERPVGPPDHSPGRNPGAKRYTPPKRPPGPEWMDAGYDHPPRTGAPGGAYAIRPYTGTIIRAIGPPRDTVIRARGARLVGRMQYAPTAVRSFGPSAHPVVRSFGPVRPARWGVFNTPLHGYDHSGHRPTPWYGHSGPWGPSGGAYAIRPYTGTRTNKPTGRRPPTPKRINNSTGAQPPNILTS